MKEYETNLKGEFLTRQEEINIIYEGPSFEKRMEISNLTSQLKSTELVIREVISELYKQKKFKKPEEVKIYLQLRKGSFQEIISVIVNNPLIAGVISATIVALFTHFLDKKKEPLLSINIQNLTNNYFLAKNLNQIIAPLELEKDHVKIISSNPSIKTSISLKEKKIMRDSLKKLKQMVAIEIYEEEFFGYLSVIDIDRQKYGFTLEGTDRHIPIIFDDKPSLREIKRIL